MDTATTATRPGPSPATRPGPGPGLAERRLNVMESRAARGAAHADTKKSFGLDWKSLKSNTSKLEGKENELVRNKEAVKNRPLTVQVRLHFPMLSSLCKMIYFLPVQGQPVHDTGNRKVERKTEGRKVDSQSSSSASVVKTAMTAAAPKKCPVHGGDTGSRTHAAAADKKVTWRPGIYFCNYSNCLLTIYHRCIQLVSGFLALVFINLNYASCFLIDLFSL